MKEKLGIRGIKTITYSWSSKATKLDKLFNENSQIDLMIERKDKIIHIIEAKFYDKEFTINKNYKENLLNKKITL